MSLQPINANNAALQWLTQVNSSANSGATSTTGSTSAGLLSSLESNGTASLSQAGQFLSKLDSLAQTDPTKFKALTSQISTELSTAAQQATGPEQQFLQNLSGQFKTASETGSAAALQPSQLTAQGQQPQGAQHHHHHHHGGGGYSSSDQSSSSSSTDLSSLFGTTSSTGSTATSAGSTDPMQTVMQQIYQQVQQA